MGRGYRPLRRRRGDGRSRARPATGGVGRADHADRVPRRRQGPASSTCSSTTPTPPSPTSPAPSAAGPAACVLVPTARRSPSDRRLDRAGIRVRVGRPAWPVRRRRAARRPATPPRPAAGRGRRRRGGRRPRRRRPRPSWDRGGGPIGRRRPGARPDQRHVSGQHAVLDVGADGRVTVADVGSRNGTWVGGRPATPAAAGRARRRRPRRRRPAGGAPARPSTTARPAWPPGPAAAGPPCRSTARPAPRPRRPPSRSTRRPPRRRPAARSAIGVMSIIAPLALRRRDGRGHGSDRPSPCSCCSARSW